MKFAICFFLILSSCTFRKNPLKNQTLKGHEQLYSEPEGPRLGSLDQDEKRIVIASTNDVHGSFSPKSISFEDHLNKGEQQIKIGGRSAAEAYFKTLRETYENVVLVDSGDIFSEAHEFDKVIDFYSGLGYDALTVGLRDFNIKIPKEIGNNTKLFQQFAKKSKVPVLLSNLYELKTARIVEWEGTKSHLIKEVGGVKVGIIGLISDDIVAQTPVTNRVGLYVENMLESTLKHARLLRSLGADTIVVMTHQSIECGQSISEDSRLPISKVNFEPQKENVCDLQNILGKYLQRLPPQLVDVVIAGRNQNKIANFVNGILVMGTYSDGKSFNYTELVINTKNKKIVPEKTVVHQPVYLCHEFFKETNDCYFEDKTIDHKLKVPAKFLGKDLTINSDNSSAKTQIQTPHKGIRSKGMIEFNADIVYSPRSSGETQLFVMAIEGRDLIKILEEDYNHNKKKDWYPSPYLEQNDELDISVSGLAIDYKKVYRVLTDLESIQDNPVFLKRITSSQSEAIMNYSWSSMGEEILNLKASAPKR